MNAQELETAKRLNLDLVVVIVEDSEMGMIRWKQEHEGFNDYALDFKNPDFEKLADAYGAKGYNIKSADEFDEVLHRDRRSCWRVRYALSAKHPTRPHLEPQVRLSCSVSNHARTQRAR